MLLYGDTPHCSVPSLSRAAAGKHQWERRKRNTPQCLPTDTVVLHPPAWLTISSTHLTHVMKSRDNNQRLQSSTHLEQFLLTTIKSANYSVTAHTPETTRNEYNVRVSLHAVLSENVKYFPTTDVHQRQVMRSPIFWETLTCLFATFAWQDGHQHLYLSRIGYRDQHAMTGLTKLSTKTAIRDC